MPPARLILVRHGESAWNAEERLQGQADAPLSALGREQAAALRPLLTAMPVDAVIASDLARAADTAKLAGFGEPRPDARWRERGLGVWEAELEADVGREPMAAFRRHELVPEGGETWSALQARVAEAVDELAARGGSTLVFTHGGCVRAAVAHALGAANADAVAGPVNASLTLLRLRPRLRLLRFNWSPDGGLPRASDPGGADGTGRGGQRP